MSLDKELRDYAQEEINALLEKAKTQDLNIDDYYDLYCNYMILENKDEGEKYKDLVKQIGMTECDNSAVVCTYLHIAFLDDKLYEESLKYINKAIDLEPNNAMYYSNRGELYFEMGKNEEGKADCEKAIHLDPTLKDEIEFKMKNFYLESDEERSKSRIKPEPTFLSKFVKSLICGLVTFILFSIFLYSGQSTLAFVILFIGLMFMKLKY